MTSKKEEEDEYLPVIEAAKSVGKSSVRGARLLFGSVFPSRESELRKKKKRIESVMAEIALVKEEKKLSALLRKLKEVEEQ